MHKHKWMLRVAVMLVLAGILIFGGIRFFKTPDDLAQAATFVVTPVL
jgi:hypothetical protein